MTRALMFSVLGATLMSCVTLDTLLYNPVPCSTVGPATCDDIEEPFDKVCVPCDQPYDWQRDYEWIPGTLEEGQTIRPIPQTAITAFTADTTDGEGSLDAYFIASHGDDDMAAGITILYSHGRYAGIEHYQPRVRYLYEAGYNVLVWDFRGFGKSLPEAAPTPEQQQADAQLMMQRALELAPDPNRVVPYAYSAGTPATVAVRDMGECAMVFEAPIAKLANFSESGTRLTLGEQFFSNGMLDSVRQMEGYAGPLLGMIGTEDEFVPGVENTAELVETTTGPRDVWVIEGASHGLAGGGIPEDAGLTAYFERLSSFLSRHCPATEPAE